jgi:hypothetical protein
MSKCTFVIADRYRAEQFRRIAIGKGLFKGAEVQTDGDGIPWLVKPVEDSLFAVTCFGPGWVFDPYAQQLRSEDWEQRRQNALQMETTQQQVTLNQVVEDLCLGNQAERLLWAIHQAVLETRSSVLVLPDFALGKYLWTDKRTLWPRQWKQRIDEVLQSLCWLHVTERGEDAPEFGSSTALLTHVGYVQTRVNEDCPPGCPAVGAKHHFHFVINIGRGLLGVLEQFVEEESDNGVRSYLFLSKAKPKTKKPTLTKVGKTGRLVTIYLPAKLGDVDSCYALTTQQHRLLQAIIRETTRTKGGAQDIEGVSAEVLLGNQIPIPAPIIPGAHKFDPAKRYVGFNGNGYRSGQGYKLVSDGGWVAKTGHPHEDLTRFFWDCFHLELALRLHLIAVDPKTSQCYALHQVRDMHRNGERAYLEQLHVRFYTRANYIKRWNQYFGWDPTDQEPDEVESDRLSDELKETTNWKNLPTFILAIHLQIPAKYFDKLLEKKKCWPPDLHKRIEAWLRKKKLKKKGVGNNKPPTDPSLEPDPPAEVELDEVDESEGDEE